MATSAAHLIRDENISIHLDGASFSGKNDISKASKKGGGLGGRKALNDISNSAKPSALQASKKHFSTNVISIGKDFDAARNKTSAAKASDKGGRRALSDLTNSSKPSAAQQASKKGLAKKLNVPASIAEEQFLHNHEKCIKAQRNAMDMDCFLKEIGLHNGVSVLKGESPRAAPKLSMKSTLETPMKLFEVEEMPELLIPSCGNVQNHGDSSPSVGSPASPKLSYMSWKDSTPYFTLIGSPNRPMH